MTRDTFDQFQSPDRGLFGENELARPRRRVTGASDLVDIACVLHHDTGKAVKVSLDGEECRAEWIPHSRCQMERSGRWMTGHRSNGQAVRLEAITLTLAEPLAQEKGLL